MNYHILTQESNLKTMNVVFHIPIPATGTNQAGLSWRDAVVREQGGSANIVSVLGTDIDPIEDTQLKAGEIIERSKRVRFSSVNLTPLQRRTQIEDTFIDLQTSLAAEKQITLEWIGYGGNV